MRLNLCHVLINGGAEPGTESPALRFLPETGESISVIRQVGR